MGRFAIKNLVLYIVIANAAVYVVNFALNVNVYSRLALIPSRVIAGEYWRLLTFVTIPPNSSAIFIFFTLYLSYMIGTTLERQWGSFRLNVYFLTGFLATIAASFIGNSYATAFYIYFSFFLAFARLYPETQFLLFFFLPFKVKWLGWLTWAMLIYLFINGVGLGERLLIIAPLLSYFLFFGKDIIRGLKSNRRSQVNRNVFIMRKAEAKTAIHKCSICGITEKDNPDIDFRYCSKCNGDHEYCMDHLQNHFHK